MEPVQPSKISDVPPGVDELVQVPTTPESRLIRPIVAVLVVIVVVIVVLNRLSKGR